MRNNSELEILLNNGYEKSIADGIRALIESVDNNKELSSEFYPLAE